MWIKQIYLSIFYCICISNMKFFHFSDTKTDGGEPLKQSISNWLTYISRAFDYTFEYGFGCLCFVFLEICYKYWMIKILTINGFLIYKLIDPNRSNKTVFFFNNIWVLNEYDTLWFVNLNNHQVRFDLTCWCFKNKRKQWPWG